MSVNCSKKAKVGGWGGGNVQVQTKKERGIISHQGGLKKGGIEPLLKGHTESGTLATPTTIQIRGSFLREKERARSDRGYILVVETWVVNTLPSAQRSVTKWVSRKKVSP